MSDTPKEMREFSEDDFKLFCSNWSLDALSRRGKLEMAEIGARWQHSQLVEQMRLKDERIRELEESRSRLLIVCEILTRQMTRRNNEQR